MQAALVWLLCSHACLGPPSLFRCPASQLDAAHCSPSDGPLRLCSYGWYFTFVQGFVYIGLILAQGFRPKHCVNPWSLYIKISAVLMFSTGLTKGSLAYLNYPAQIMFKSTKVSRHSQHSWQGKPHRSLQAGLYSPEDAALARARLSPRQLFRPCGFMEAMP
jgi:hypothetical protein